MFFCLFCDDVKDYHTQQNLKDHLVNHFIDVPASETEWTSEWIQRHVEYIDKLRESLRDKPPKLPDGESILFKGCRLCDRIIKVYKLQFDYPLNGLEVWDILDDFRHQDYKHISPHLKYYRFRCSLCQNNGQIEDLINITEMKKHFIKSHQDIASSRDTPEMIREDVIEITIRTLERKIFPRKIAVVRPLFRRL